nr:hypothetical protein [Pirellulales bacterium]
EVPEFIEIDASSSGSTLTLTSATAGVPFTLTRSDTAATAADEVQTVTIGGTATGGTFTLTYAGQTTAAIAYNADAATVDAALEALANIGAGDVTCTGGALPGAAVIVTFTGALALTDVDEMTASGTLLTGTSPTVAVATTTHGGAAGALGAVTAVTPATGKNWLNNADNYEGGALPIDDDVLYIDAGSTSILYALDYFRTGSIDLVIYVSNDWTGQLGLPLDNVSGYQEYRTPRYFQYRGGSKTLNFIPGTTGTSGQGRCWVDLQDQAGVNINVDANRGSSTPNIFLAGGDATSTNNFFVTAGDVSIEPDDAPSAITKYANLGTTTIGTPGGTTTPVVTIGRNARLAQAATSVLEILSGSVTCYAQTLNGADECEVYVFGGTARMKRAPHWKYVIRDGTLFPGGDDDGAIEEIQQFGGVVDFREANHTHAVADFDVHAGSAIYDPDRRGVTDLDLIGCQLDQITLELPPNRHIDFATEATP